MTKVSGPSGMKVLLAHNGYQQCSGGQKGRRRMQIAEGMKRISYLPLIGACIRPFGLRKVDMRDGEYRLKKRTDYPS